MAKQIRQIEDKKNEVEATYREIIEANALIGKCSNTKNFNPKAMLKLYSFKKKLTEETEAYQKVFADIMEQYGIKDTNGVFDWREHKEVEEISKKVTDLVNAKVTIKGSNFLDGDAFISATENLNMNEMQLIGKFILQDDAEETKEEAA